MHNYNPIRPGDHDRRDLVARPLVRVFELALGLQQGALSDFDVPGSAFHDPLTQLRINHYRRLAPGSRKAVAIPAHTDSTFFT